VCVVGVGWMVSGFGVLVGFRFFGVFLAFFMCVFFVRGFGVGVLCLLFWLCVSFCYLVGFFFWIRLFGDFWWCVLVSVL